MKSVLISSLIGAAAASTYSPTGKVVQMLEEMKAKGRTRLQEEQVEFAKFSQFCAGETVSLKKDIAEGKEEVESLSADINKARTDAADLGNDIQALSEQIDKYKAEMDGQRKMRAKDNKEFLLEQQDLDESVDALARAIAIMKRENYDRKQAESFLQTEETIPSRAKVLIQDFMSADPDFLNPEANAYEHQSGGIIEMLKKLSRSFSKQLDDSRKGEMNGKHAFELAMQHLTDATRSSEESVSKKTNNRNKRLAHAAKQSKELASTQETLDTDTKTLADLETECHEKSESFKEKQKLALDEVEALGEAIKILDGDSVQGGAARNLGLAQKATVLLQINSSVLRRDPDSADVISFLHRMGRKLESNKLSLLADKMTADPFIKVKKMIKAMVNRLRDEASKELAQHSFCQKELGTNKITRDNLSQKLNELNADFEENTATEQKLGEEIAALGQQVTELARAMAEATENRNAEKKKNVQTIKEAKEAQQAVARAGVVLKKFYAKAAAATALVQVPTMGSDEWDSLANPAFKGTGAGYGQGSEDKTDTGHKQGMQTFGDKYSGQQESANGVLAMLEVITADFANVESETQTAEASAAKNYERFMVDGKRDSTVKSHQIEMKKADQAEAGHDAKAAENDMKNVQEQYDAALKYYDGLKPQCVNTGVTKEERDAKRKEEIEALKEALEMLQPDE